MLGGRAARPQTLQNTIQSRGPAAGRHGLNAPPACPDRSNRVRICSSMAGGGHRAHACRRGEFVRLLVMPPRDRLGMRGWLAYTVGERRQGMG